MGRRVDRIRRDLPADVTVDRQLRITIDDQLRKFLEREALRLSRKHKHTIQDVIRAVLAAYYEKRAMSLLINPDD